MSQLRELEAWFVTGSQHLYGPDVLQTVEDHARRIAECLEESRTSRSGSSPSAW